MAYRYKPPQQSISPRAAELLEQYMEIHDDEVKKGYRSRSSQQITLDVSNIGRDSEAKELADLLPSKRGQGSGYGWERQQIDRLDNLYLWREEEDDDTRAMLETQQFPSILDIDKAAREMLPLKQGESVIINGHEVTFDNGRYSVATNFGYLNYANPDDAARYCICVILKDESSKSTEELKDKYDKVEQRVEKLEAKIAPAIRTMQAAHIHRPEYWEGTGMFFCLDCGRLVERDEAYRLLGLHALIATKEEKEKEREEEEEEEEEDGEE
jgi:hypothetical protein